MCRCGSDQPATPAATLAQAPASHAAAATGFATHFIGAAEDVDQGLQRGNFIAQHRSGTKRRRGVQGSPERVVVIGHDGHQNAESWGDYRKAPKPGGVKQLTKPGCQSLAADLGAIQD